MKIELKKLIIILLLVIFCCPSLVNANNGSATGGSGGGAGSNCPSCKWTYRVTAIRLSLYKYDGTNLAYYGSVDYCNWSTGCGGYYAFQSKRAGKLAYQNLGYDVLANWEVKPTSIVEEPAFKIGEYFSDGYTSLNAAVKSYLNLNNSRSTSEILQRINSVFYQNLSASDLGMFYITVEPALHISNGQGGEYYGTMYELSRFFGGKSLNGITGYVYKRMPEAIMASKIEGSEDKYGLVGASEKLVNLVPNSALSSYESIRDNSSYRTEAYNKITSNDGYGIAVYWIGDYVESVSCSISENSNIYTLTVNNSGGETVYYDIDKDVNSLVHNEQTSSYNAGHADTNIYGKVYNSSGNEIASCSYKRDIRTCSETCSGKSGDSLLGCAEDYCQVMSGDSDEKKECITGCGYSDPGFSGSCSDSNTNGKDTVCDEATTASNKKCTASNSNSYYKTTCVDTSTIKYGSSLPVTINAGLGFSYSPIVMGSKVCEITFDVEKFKFDYASAYTTEQRNKLLSKLNAYNDVSDNSIWIKDVNDIYKYDSSDAKLEIKVTNSNDTTKSNRTTTKRLVVNKTINLLDKDIRVSSGGTANVPLYAFGSIDNKTIFSFIKTTSSNETAYKLPGTCINSGDGTLYDLGPNGYCESTNDGPYYQYYTDLKIEKGTYDTNTSVSKDSSNLSVNNTCNYNVNIPVSCSIALKCSNDKIVSAELRIENKNKLNITYGISSNGYNLNNKSLMDITNDMEKIYGAVGINGEIVTTCSVELENASCESNCEENYKPAQYDKIGKYCNNHWMEDVANYASEKDCYNSCSSGANTCKNNPEVDTNSVESVKKFCLSKQNRDENGYNKGSNDKYNVGICINDCLDIEKGNNCLGIACDYLYRPISLKDPFPNNRNAGYNWYGKEIFITDDLLNPLLNSAAEPEYVIELTPDIIKSINRQTNEYNSKKNKNAYIDYVYNNENSRDGKYISKFIHSNDIESGGFGLYFSKKID